MEKRIVPAIRSFGFRSVIIVALILEDRVVLQHQETVREAARNEELTLVVPAQHYAHILAQRRRAGTDVHRHVEHAAPHDAQEFGLRLVAFLEMKAAQHAFLRRKRFVVLHEMHRPDLLQQFPLHKRFEEIAAVVAENAGLNDQGAFNVSF